MRVTARWPEDLEVLLEDAFVLRDNHALADLFEAGAVVAAADGEHQVAELGEAIWELGFWSGPSRVIQSGAMALVVGAGTVNVLQRGTDGSWRYVICLFGSSTEAGRDDTIDGFRGR